MMDGQHLDGNGVAGLLNEIAGAEMTSVQRTCATCGETRPMADHRAYRSAGVVLRCPGCDDIAMAIGVQETRLVVSWQGTYQIER
jgi:ribosomal protein S27AE